MAFVTSPVSLLVFICFVCAIRDSVQMPTNAALTTTTELANTTAANATAHDASESPLVPNAVGSIAKNNNYTNYSLKDQKLLVNNSLNLDTSQLPRNIASSASQSSAGFSITLVAVLLVVITLIVSIILTAVFVMRRRFSIWRVNGDRLTGGGRGDDGAKGALTKSTSSENTSTAGEAVKVETETTVKETTAALTTNESQKSIECEKKLDDEQVKEVVASCIAELNSVENPQALICVTEPVKPAETCVEGVEPKTEEVKADVETKATVEQQPSPATSETRLIETTVSEEDSKVKEQPIQAAAAKSASTVSLSSSAVNPVSPIPSSNDLNPSAAEPAPAAVTTTTNTVSSTSLITNVISDIADSVASKLSAKSASKSALNDNNDEKQPLNNE